MAAILVTPQDWSTGSPIYKLLAYGNQAYNVYNAGSGYRFDANAAHALSSTDGNALRFEVRAGDTNWYDIGSGKERSEIGSTEPIDYGTALHVSYDFMIEPGLANTATWAIFGQIHQAVDDTDYSGPPPFALELRGEKMSAVIRHTDADGNLILTRMPLDTANIVRGQTYAMDIYATFDNSTDQSRLVVVRDGVVVVDYMGPLGMGSSGQVYWKEGIYRSAASETLAAVYSNLTIDHGDMVQIPAYGETTHVLAEAPTLGVESGSIEDGVATTIFAGVAEAGATVAIFNGADFIGAAVADETGHYRFEMKLTPDQYLFTAATIDANGVMSATSRELPIEVATSADVVGRLNYLTGMQDLGNIYLTDSHTLVVGKVADMTALITDSQQTLSAIESGYNFGIWNGTANNRTFTTYDATGQAIESYTTSVRDGETLLLTHKIFTPGAYVTMEMTAFQVAGQPFSWVYRAFTTGNKQIAIETYRSDNSLYSASYEYQDGSKSARTFDQNGAMLTNVITTLDGSTRTLTYEDGILVSDHMTNSDGAEIAIPSSRDEPLHAQAMASAPSQTTHIVEQDGDNTYFVRSATDQVIGDRHGMDTVYTPLHSYRLTEHVEKLVYTGTGDAILMGNASSNTLIAGRWNDHLDGGAGADTMEGRGGDDTYVVDHKGDIVVEAADAGFDTIETTLTQFQLSANVEALRYTGTVDATLFGNALSNTIHAGDGNDSIDGREGADLMFGGRGNDTYVVDDAGDRIVEAVGEGRDLVYSSVGHTLDANVEDLTLTGANAISGTGNALANHISGNDAANVLDGGAGNDVLRGNGGFDILRGGDGMDMLYGGSGKDTLYGGAGVDRLSGGLGADRFVFEAGDTGRLVASADRILDFSHAQGDLIDVSAIDADRTMAGNQAFTFFAEKPVEGVAGALWMTNTFGYYQILGDTNGDNVADIMLLVDTQFRTAITQSDFVL